ncbi:MAG: NADH-quinone oxidoreductase subunit NuoK [Gemmatales bacterium]|nr:NADH-quinone oxidoreductase subunit NuoK [Gemmatales bacterium]MDW8387923.1 NADH-quinone oxidoreductase subunit NuoK [Gemmatales bacterium]
MTPILHNYLVVGSVLFVLGAIGFLTRRNLIIVVLCVEMMLQGVALNLVAFGAYHRSFSGQVFTIMMLTVAACEAALALALVLALYRRQRTLDVSVWQTLREPEVEPEVEETPPEEPPPPPPEFPRLTPAGLEPKSNQAEEAAHV